MLGGSWPVNLEFSSNSFLGEERIGEYRVQDKIRSSALARLGEVSLTAAYLSLANHSLSKATLRASVREYREKEAGFSWN